MSRLQNHMEAARMQQAVEVQRKHQEQRDAPLGGQFAGWDAKSGNALAQLPGGGIIPLRPTSNGHPGAGPLEISGGGPTRPDGDWPPRPPQPEEEEKPTTLIEIHKERLGDIPNPQPFEVKVTVGGKPKSQKFPTSELIRMPAKSGTFKAEEVGIDPQEIVNSIYPSEARLSGSRLTWDEGSSNACICTNCKPQIVFEGITNADSPVLAINVPTIPTLKRKRVGGKINPDIKLYWRLIEVGSDGLSGLRYGQNEVSEDGVLLQLPATFTSNFSYNGYMEVQIGCYSSQTNEILWPRGQRTNPG